MRYRVEVDPFAVMHTRIIEVEANSLEEACEKAEAISDTWTYKEEIYYEAHYAEEIA